MISKNEVDDTFLSLMFGTWWKVGKFIPGVRQYLILRQHKNLEATLRWPLTDRPRKREINERFSWLEQSIQKIPNWLLVSVVSVAVCIATFWASSEGNPRIIIFPEKFSFDSIELAISILLKQFVKELKTISIVSAALLYYKEVPLRRGNRHREAWQIIDNSSQNRYLLMMAVGEREEYENIHSIANSMDQNWSLVHLWGQEKGGKEKKSCNSFSLYIAVQELNKDNVSLKGLFAPYSQFSRIRLEDADLRESTLNNSSLEGAILNCANFSGAILNGACFNDANLYRAHFLDAKLNNASFLRASLHKAFFKDAELDEAKMGPDLRGANFESAKLRNAEIRFSNLEGANLERADLEGADLSNSILIGVDLFCTNLENIKYNSETIWPDKSEVSEALNVPVNLQRQLGIECSSDA